MNIKKSILTERISYFDYLRVFAVFAVIILHVSAQNWDLADVNGSDWQIFNFYDSIVRWGVPVFVMISGALFLPREISIKEIYSKYILRMAIAFFVWSIIYAVFEGGGLTSYISNFINGYYHMWFILMIIGLYICLPLIKELIKKEVLIKYFLMMSLIFAFIIPEITTLSNDFGEGELIRKGISAIAGNVENMDIHLVLGYVSYFILGYYLNEIDLNKKQRILIYLSGLMGFVLTIFLNLAAALKTQVPCGNYYDSFNINVLLEAISVFTFFKYANLKRACHIMAVLSEYTFGTYLVHAFVIEILDLCFGLNSLSFHSAAAVPVIGILVFAISFGISALLNHIPILKKYIV